MSGEHGILGGFDPSAFVCYTKGASDDCFDVVFSVLMGKNHRKGRTNNERRNGKGLE